MKEVLAGPSDTITEQQKLNSMRLPRHFGPLMPVGGAETSEDLYQVDDDPRPLVSCV